MTALSTTFVLSSLVLPVDPLQVNFIIDYAPSSELISFDWTTPLDVLRHLLSHRKERDQLRNEASQRSCGRPQTFKIWHHLLGCQLSIDSFGTDYIFVSAIKNLIVTIEWRTGVVSTTQDGTTTQTTPITLHPSPTWNTIEHAAFTFVYERF